MKSLSFLVAFATVGCCFGQLNNAISYDLPSGSFRYQNQYESLGQVKPQVRYIQAKYVQPEVKPVAKYIVQASPVKPVIPPVAILSMNSDSTYDGNFKYDFASENGIQSTAAGSVKTMPGSEIPAQVISGSYSYTAPDGTPVVTSWYADETGFHAEGSHLPVAPPVPQEIQRSLEFLRSLPPNPEDHKWD